MSWESEPPAARGIPRHRASRRRRSMVLISPLWASPGKGWARSTVGRVLVEYLEWPMAEAVRRWGLRSSS